MIAIEPSTFYAAFQQFPHPACLKTAAGWLFNPAAEAAGISSDALELLIRPGSSSSLWLDQQFYHATISQAQEDTLVLLQPDRFLSGDSVSMSNQLRQHLSAAFYPIQDLAELEAIQEDETARDALSALNHALFQILRAVGQLDLCAMGQDAFCTNTEPMDLAGFLTELVREVSPLCQQAGVTLSAEPELSSLFTVADEKMLKYLFLHLLSNSLKYTPKGGSIHISLKRQGDHGVFTLSDSGALFSPEVLSDPLWGQPNRIQGKRGLGLGLPIAQRIAAAHGGSLTVLSVGRTPRVVVSLPLRRSSELVLMSPHSRLDRYAGFSPTMIVLSDALPPQLYFPQLEGEDTL